jgi:hypothetical protein
MEDDLLPLVPSKFMSIIISNEFKDVIQKGLTPTNASRLCKFEADYIFQDQVCN